MKKKYYQSIKDICDDTDCKYYQTGVACTNSRTKDDCDLYMGIPIPVRDFLSGNVDLETNKLDRKDKKMSALTQAADDAFMRGDKTFIFDKPCANGHTSERYVSNHKCIACYKLSQAKTVEGKKK